MTYDTVITLLQTIMKIIQVIKIFEEKIKEKQ